jgi:branched-chain amino acid transport system permease protein
MPDVSMVIFQLLNGLIWGLILALLAVGLNLIYGLLNIVNVAHGALFMAGAYIGWLAVTYMGSFVLGLIVAPLVVGIAGLTVERTVLRPLAKSPDLTIIATIGIMLMLEQGALWLFGGDVRSVASPIDYSISIAGMDYPAFRVFVALGAVLVLVGLWMFLQRTRYGLWTRAVKFSPTIAGAFGVPTNRVIALTFGIGSGLAALGGVLASPIVNVRPEMGLDVLITVFIIVIVGGLGNLFGSVLAAVLMTTSEGLAGVFTSPTNARLISLVALTLIVLRWPDGIGAKGGKRWVARF